MNVREIWMEKILLAGKVRNRILPLDAFRMMLEGSFGLVGIIVHLCSL